MTAATMHKPIAYDPNPQRISYTKWISITVVWATFFFLTNLGALTLAARAISADFRLALERVGVGFALYAGTAIVFAIVVGTLNRALDPDGAKRAARNRAIQEKYSGKIPTFVSLPGSFGSAVAFCLLTALALALAGTPVPPMVVLVGAVFNLPTAIVGAFITGLVLKRMQATRKS
jgi:hypothetical protein